MAAGDAPKITAALIERGMPADRPVAVVRSASLAEEECRVGPLRDLATLASGNGGGPATIVIGEVLRERAIAAARPFLFASASGR